MQISWTTRLFLFGEVTCFFLYSIWWRKEVPLSVGVMVGGIHLLGLILILRYWEYTRTKTLFSNRSDLCKGIQGDWTLVSVLIFAGIAQGFYLVLPVVSGPDEPVLLLDQINQASQFFSMTPVHQLAFLLCCVGLGWVSCRLTKPYIDAGLQANCSEGRHKSPLVLALIGFLFAYAFLESGSSYIWGLSERWPPLGTVLSLPLQILVSDKVIAIRLLSVIFYLATAVMIFRMIVEETGRSTALLGTVMLLACPVFFVYGHYAFREMGGVFFITLGVYLLIRFLRDEQPDIYGMAVAAATLGYLYRRLSVLLAILIGLVLLSRYGKNLFRWHNFRALAMPPIALIWILLPWYVISHNVRAYVPYADNLQIPQYLLAYLIALPGLIGWPLGILALAGLAIGFGKKSLTWQPVLYWLILLCLLFAMDVTAPKVVPRFAVHFVPPLVVLACLAISSAERLFQPLRIIGGLILILFMLATVAIWQFDDERNYRVLPANGIREIASPRYPYDEVAKWLAGQSRKIVLYQPFPWQSSLVFYKKTMGLKHVTLIAPSWRSAGNVIRLKSAIHACQEQKCDYLVLPAHKNGKLLFFAEEFAGDIATNSGALGVKVFENRYGDVLVIDSGLIER